MSSLLRFNAASTARNRPLTGDTKSSFVLDDHLGWLKCDGRGMDKVLFNLLFQVIGYQFGGSGNTFNLPNLQGRVMGNTGFVTDQNSRTRTFAPGTSTGELDHKLIQSEMPSHNHDDSTSPVIPNGGSTAKGNTSTSVTGVTDSGHTHIYSNQSNDTDVSGANVLSTTIADNVDVSHTTDTGYAVIVDPGHTHTIASNGGDQYHNNIQPTLFYGNTFIYSGVPITKDFPFLFPFHAGRNPVLI